MWRGINLEVSYFNFMDENLSCAGVEGTVEEKMLYRVQFLFHYHTDTGDCSLVINPSCLHGRVA